MPEDDSGPTPPAEVAEELGYDVETLARCDVSLMAYGEGSEPIIDLSIMGPTGPDRVPVPDRFVGLDDVVDVAGLAEWLGLRAATGSALPSTVTLQQDPDSSGGEWGFSEAEDGTVHLGAFANYVSPYGLLVESLEDAKTAAEPTSFSGLTRPELGDTDAWPDTVDGWRAAIRHLRAQSPIVRAADVRMFFAGLNDQVLEHTQDGPVDQDGRPIEGEGETNTPDGGSWDPATDPLDPALEEALRLERVPGALPPPDAPEELPSRADPTEGEADENTIDVEFDNTIAIVDDSAADREALRWGCLGQIARHWGLALAGLVVLVIVSFVAFQVLGGDGGETEDATDVGAEATPEELLERATQELLDGRSAEVEQTFTVSNAQGETPVSSVGAVDFASGESRLEVDVTAVAPPADDRSLLEVVITPDSYSFRLRLPEPQPPDLPASVQDWVQAAPGEINDTPEVGQAGLGYVGIGEALDPAAIVRLVQSLTDVTAVDRGSQTSIEGTATLPVTGEGSESLDNLTNAMFGHPQSDLRGVRLQTEVVLGDGETIQIKVVADLEEAIPVLQEDPDVENLRGITLTNVLELTPGPFGGPEPEDAIVLLEFIRSPIVLPEE